MFKMNFEQKFILLQSFISKFFTQVSIILWSLGFGLTLFCGLLWWYRFIFWGYCWDLLPFVGDFSVAVRNYYRLLVIFSVTAGTYYRLLEIFRLLLGPTTVCWWFFGYCWDLLPFVADCSYFLSLTVSLIYCCFFLFFPCLKNKF